VSRIATPQKPLARAVALACIATGIAVSPALTYAQHVMHETVISGSRILQDIDAVPATITTISAEEIAQQNPTDLEDLLRHEAGVSVRSQPNRSSGVFRATGRAGNEGVNIRGLEGDQVRLQVDGVALPMTYASGPYAAGRGDVIDPEGYKRVEILRGASSTQYGSDGLAGAVSFLTKDPSDILTLGNDTQVNIKLGYSSADESWLTAPSAAFKSGIWQGMVLAAIRHGKETETMGDNTAHNITRTAANPADRGSHYVLAKLIAEPSKEHRIALTLETIERDNDTKVLTFFQDPFAPATLTGVDVAEDISRTLTKLDYRYTPAKPGWFDVLSASVYQQDAENVQTGLETRSTNPRLRTRKTQYEEDTLGGNVQLESSFGEGGQHRLVYGVDVAVNDVTSFKDGLNSSGAAFVPNKSFPDTEYTTLGAFLQSELKFGALSVMPGVRFDRFKLDPSSDRYYRINNTTAPTKLEDDELSPRLGAVWTIAPLIQPFAQYAHGFRAPKPTQVNGGVSNLTVLTGTGPYVSLGNPNLKPETSDSYEIGLRGRDATVRYSLAAFQGKYDDFILGNQLVQSNVNLGLGTLVDVFQAVNLNKVSIEGFEARGEWAFHRDWTLTGAYAHAKGDSKTDGVKSPLVSIDPDKLIVGLRHAHEGHWGGELNVTSVERKERNPDPTMYTSDDYVIADLSAWYALSKTTRINASLNNLFDRKYVEWADVRDLAATSNVVDAYSQPGRNFTVSVSHSF
jgi:hemoglobin/transferrin/lactoferrin receptor protein